VNDESLVGLLSDLKGTLNFITFILISNFDVVKNPKWVELAALALVSW
jgi:hypothetical protein